MTIASSLGAPRATLGRRRPERNARRAFEQERFDLLLDQLEICERASQLKRFAVECRAPAAKVNRADEGTVAWLRWVEENATQLNSLVRGIDAVREATVPRGS